MAGVHTAGWIGNMSYHRCRRWLAADCFNSRLPVPDPFKVFRLSTKCQRYQRICLISLNIFGRKENGDAMHYEAYVTHHVLRADPHQDAMCWLRSGRG